MSHLAKAANVAASQTKDDSIPIVRRATQWICELKMHAVHLTNFGEPSQVLTHVEVPEPPRPRAAEVQIQVHYSPLSWGDLVTIRRAAPIRSTRRSVIGTEGSGTIVSVGEEVTHVKPGDKVLVPCSSFAWAERVNAPASKVFALPTDIDMQQAAMARVNPTTAYLLLTEIVKLHEGSWIAQNAGTSGVGRAVIAMAKTLGLRTVSFVRREEARGELLQAGADVAILESDTAAKEAWVAIKGEPIALAFDGVGGTSAALLGAVAAANSTIVSYASMSGEPVAIRFQDVGKRVSLRGFNLYYPAFVPKHAQALSTGLRLIAEGAMRFPVARTYPLTAVKDAIAHVRRGGKILLEAKSALA